MLSFVSLIGTRAHGVDPSSRVTARIIWDHSIKCLVCIKYSATSFMDRVMLVVLYLSFIQNTVKRHKIEQLVLQTGEG